MQCVFINIIGCHAKIPFLRLDFKRFVCKFDFFCANSKRRVNSKLLSRRLDSCYAKALTTVVTCKVNEFLNFQKIVTVLSMLSRIIINFLRFFPKFFERIRDNLTTINALTSGACVRVFPTIFTCLCLCICLHVYQGSVLCALLITKTATTSVNAKNEIRTYEMEIPKFKKKLHNSVMCDER